MDPEGIVRCLVERFNSMQPGEAGVDRIAELYHPDLVWREAATSMNPEGRGGGFETARAAMMLEGAFFTDRRVELREVVYDGDRVAALYTWTATVAADLGAGMAPIGTQVSVENALFMRIAEGLIIEVTELQTEPAVVELAPPD